ncbi:TonB-dependent receptor [Novosphingobium sp.]|uniref:TonB-dependent receptor n=1 Tax=Novosphingobium sp. TaxID=1874826 RepID=UPI0022C5604D|nr:TonB-dependent receptor [Novosphingobium sp.]MCZ8018034.1 TonB-dependent receptor [Novosphingobium sp.]MCZ8034353.1 TonB-dependent receptor [Novosphingobium sp.]MCZ8052321.1 TonB-dependent receptor [Novosphingobium sp.]MCZ8061186.1 TonB-dependent receptor [Novosphingobium sp.]MCZ8232817.1 TonB-dependent receptor [Novosphingobium sp.]
MRGKLTLLAGVCASAIAFPAFAQDAQGAEEDDANVIIVTAQRSNQRLQDVPIAVSAFSSEALEKQQIKNTSDLQLTLPNVTFTKGNFTGSSFTIRGIGDLCVGVTCDSATAIHMNDAPLYATRLFEGEFYDLAQIEVLRGPQGTLFGRNATSGVVNFRTARPDLSGMAGNFEAEYGNYNSFKLKGMVNAPIGETVAVRLAGFYLNREGYTTNLFDNSKIDNRDLWGARASIRFEPSTSTTIDLMAQYFHEKDNRMRIQKQLCQRDPTGVLGCLNASRDYGTTNSNTSFVGVLTSREFLAANGIPNVFGLGSLYGPDPYATVVNPADPRVVNTDYTPTYFAEEWIVQGSIDQDLGNGLSVKLSGNWQQTKVDSSQDYNNSVQNRAVMQSGLNTLAAAAAGGIPGLPAAYFAPIAAALIPNGPTGLLCTSLTDPSGMGAYGANRQRLCSMTPQDFDRSNQDTESWSAELILSSDWDGMFNFLLGGIYGKGGMSENSYYVNSFGIDYLTGLLGTFNALGRAGVGAIPGAQVPPPGFLGTPFYRNNSDQLDIRTYGIFGEAYFKFNDQLKLTLGLRYNNDEKTVTARTTLANFLVPFGGTDMFASPYINGWAVTGAPVSSRLQPYDADPATACTINSTTASGILTSANISGCEPWQIRTVKFSEWTGRAVLDYQITPDNLVYASYSRGYKSGGVNPPLSPVFAVPEGFGPEFVNAFEVGSKNTFGNVQLNVTGFYYQYKNLQLSRIVARTSVNDNVSANVWGLEAEAIFRPTRELAINVNASYLNTKVSEDKFLSNPRDFGAGRADAVIIKDITNGANCAVASNTGSASGVNGFVNQVNTLINAGAVTGNAGANLQPTTAFPSGSGINSTGAFSICAALAGLAPTVGAGFGGVTVYSSGIPVNIKGNKLPGAPDYKFSAGVQYDFPVGDMTLTPRADFIYTGKSYGNIFNGSINRIDSYTQVNAQLQLDGPDKKWFARVWVQNLFDKDAITGLYVTDQSSGNYTNIFTLEPRRFGLTAGIKF